MAANYVSTRAGPLRIWRGGTGPPLVMLPGLVMSACVTAHRLARAHPTWAITVIELPGVGGSARIEPQCPAQIAEVIDDALGRLGIGQAVVLAHDLSAPIALALAALRPAPALRLLLVDAEPAWQWVSRGVTPPSLELREDGMHLAALWTHFRDRAMLDPADPVRVARTGSPLPTTQDLDTAVIAASVNPSRYAALWVSCAAGFDRSASSGHEVESSGVGALLAQWSADIAPTGATAAAAGPVAAGVRYEYLQTPSGRVHMRRAGSGGRTLLVFHSAPGSAEPLEGLIQGLAQGREVVACDYLGNGDSDKVVGDVDIATLARHGREIADALRLDKVDLFGTHTGAMVAMEFAIRWPTRAGRMVLEAPVLIDPAFAADILEHYLPPLLPDRWGTHLLRAWNMRRDMFLFWPWYRQSRDAARSLGTPSLATLHDWTVGLLKSGTTYRLSYGAAFIYETRSRLPLLPCPAMICAGPADMLVEGLEEARRLAPADTVVAATPATVWYPGQSAEAVRASIAIYEKFLSGG